MHKLFYSLLILVFLLSGCQKSNLSSINNSETINTVVDNVEDNQLPYSIYLSPSKQSHNLYANDLGSEEKNMTDIAIILEDLLVNRGFTVYSNTSLISPLSLANAVLESNKLQPNIHLSLHSNASTSHTASGLEVYYKDKEDKLLSEHIYNALRKELPSTYNHRGTIQTDELYELNVSTSPACLAEILFHDEVNQAIFIVNNKELIANALFKGILSYFELNN